MRGVNEYQKAAIIGMWRSGAEIITISVYTGLPELVVKRIIENYKKTFKNKIQ
jgi:hypothetical protein